MLRSSAAMHNLSALVEGGHDFSKEAQAALCVSGSVALDTSAKVAIKQRLLEVGLRTKDDRLHPTGLGQELAALLAVSSAFANSATSPCWTLLLSCDHPDAIQVLNTLVGHAEGAQEDDHSLVAKYGDCFATAFDTTVCDKLFPPYSDESADTSLTASSESVLTPEHEKRVFTFINETSGHDDHAEDANDLAGELPAFPKTPEPLSSASRRPRPSSTNADLGRSLSRPTSAAATAAATTFRARPAPSSTPSITPRLSKTAALRMGLELPEKERSARPSIADDASLPGIVRRPVTPPRSLAQPDITPRQTKASAARLLKDQEGATAILKPTSRRQSTSTSERSAGFEGLPGFGGRRLSVQSTVAQPKIMPKQTKSSALRTSIKEGVLPSLPTGTQRRQSYTTAERAALFGSIGASSGSAHARRTSIASLQAPATAPKQTKSSLLRNGTGARVISPPLATAEGTPRMDGRVSTTPRPASVASNASAESRPKSGLASNAAPLKVAQVKKPAIVPRVNKAAELRLAARMAQV